jgi:uncharacterized protein
MKVAEIWRYPIKSMGGEKLQKATLSPLGICGDRVVHVEDARGHFATARKYPRLLGFHGTLDSSGDPSINSVHWTDPTVLPQIVAIVGPGARLVHDTSRHRFDVLPLLVATDGAIKEFGHDGRRLRPNIIIGGVEGLAERSWPGRCLGIGDVLVGIEDFAHALRDDHLRSRHATTKSGSAQGDWSKVCGQARIDPTSQD